MAARKVKIDLLPREGFSQRTSGRFLLWALTVGRYIAIFTELVVISGVIARFTLDYQRNSITEDILEQQAILASYKPTEQRIRRLDQQFETVANLELQNLGVEKLLLLLPEITPIDMQFDSLNLSYESIKISGNSLSLQGFSTFVLGLQAVEDFSDIILDSIESGGPQDPSIYFALTIDLGRSLPEETETTNTKTDSDKLDL